MRDARGDAAWTDPAEPPRIGTDPIKVDDRLWAIWLDEPNPHPWHWCTRAVQNARPDATGDRDPGWMLAGTGAHTLHSREPLHLEASVYWPDCCGMHGWVRDGRWVSA